MGSAAPSAERLARDLLAAVLNAAEQAGRGGCGDDDTSRLQPLEAALVAGGNADYNLARPDASEVVTPLLCAVRAGDKAAALKLLKSRREGAPDFGSPLSTALAVSPTLLAALLDAGCDPCAGCGADGNGANALHACVRAPHTPSTNAVLRTLFAASGGDARLSGALMARDNTGGTPLLWAARAGAPLPVLTSMIEAPGGRAALNVADRFGNTPLHVALDPACVRLLLAEGADAALRNGAGSVLGAHLARDAPVEIVVALLQTLELALSSSEYWPADGEAEQDGKRYDGPTVGGALLAALAAEGAPATPPWCDAGYLWRCCNSAAAVRWLAASGCTGGGRVPAAHAVALLRSAVDADDTAMAAELVAAGADLVGDAATLGAQVANARRATEDLLRVCSGSHEARAENAAPVLALLAGAAAASYGSVIAKAISDVASQFAAGAEAREAELAASDAVIPTGDAAWLASFATLDDFRKVAMVALLDPVQYDRSVAWQTLRNPFPEHPHLANQVLAVLDARRLAERRAESAAWQRYSRAGRARNSRALSNAIAAALGLPQVVAPVVAAAMQPEPEQAAADSDAHLTLQCQCGGTVVAPKSAVDKLNPLHGIFKAEADVCAAGNAVLPQMPVTASQLELVFELIAAGNGKPVTAAAIEAAAAMLEERCRAPGAGEVAALPLLEQLRATDLVGAPIALSWAAAVAAARALKREGEKGK